jgi:hypothetical protein
MTKKSILVQSLAFAMISRIGDNDYPHVVTVNGTQVPISEIPEFKTVIEQISADERRKVYSRLETLERQNQTLLGEIQTLKANTNSPQTTPNNPQGTQQPKETWDLSGISKEQIKSMLNEVNANTQIDYGKLAEAMSINFKESLGPVLAQLNSVKEVIQPLKEKAVIEYRATRLAQLGDTVLPELVKGSTEAEIEASIPNAVEMRKLYAPVTAPIAPVNPNPGAPVVVTPAQPIVIPSAVPVMQVQNTGSALDGVKGMSTEEFAKNRAAMMKEVEAKLGN